MNVHQVLSGAGPRDAVTGIALGIRAQLTAWGIGGRDHAARIAPGCPGAFVPLKALAAPASDTLLIHHSAAIPQLDAILDRANPKLLLYHNVTPAGWLWEDSPVLAAQCEIGRAQLAEIVPRVDVAAADSAFNARELSALGARHTAVIAPLVDRGRLGAPSSNDRAQTARRPTVLFVGRLSPHKCQDQVIEAFGLLRRRHLPDARLVLVGEPIGASYTARLQALADAAAPGTVAVQSGLTDAELGERYRGADAFLCLSAHEGFCIPLLEAMEMAVPVIARACGAVPEVAGEAALLVEPRERLDVVAELLALVLRDRELRDELVRRGRDRVALYSREASVAALRQALEQTASVAGARA